MVTDSVMVQRRAQDRRGRAGPGFTLIDLLVSITIIGVLIGLMLPGLSRIRESTRRVVCSSNLRQHGLGVAMYAEDYRGAMPPSWFAGTSAASQTGVRDEEDSWNSSQKTVFARAPIYEGGQWDGLGWLFSQDYLPASGVFYCPSHHGEYPYRAVAHLWMERQGALVTNYQYRGGDLLDSKLFTDRTAIVTDAMRSIDEYNHIVGCNVLRRDLSVSWFHDRTGSLADSLALSIQDRDAGQRVEEAWNQLDNSSEVTPSE